MLELHQLGHLDLSSTNFFSAFCLDFEKHIFCLAMVNHEHIAQVYFFWQILEDFFSAELYVKLSVFLI